MRNEFDGLDDAFGLSHDITADRIIDKSPKVDNCEIANHGVSGGEFSECLRDTGEYGDLQKSLVDSINKSSMVLDIISKQIMIGTPASVYTASAELINAVTGQQNALRAILKDKADIALKLTKLKIEAAKISSTDETESDGVATGGINMSPADLMEMLDKARGESSMNRIDATFEIGEN